MMPQANIKIDRSPHHNDFWTILKFMLSICSNRNFRVGYNLDHHIFKLRRLLGPGPRTIWRQEIKFCLFLTPLVPGEPRCHENTV